MPRIAISYRRDDSAAITGRIFDRLVARYGSDSVFRDIDNIPLGVDFREYINTILAQTDITLVVVGKRWFGARRGRRRIDDPADPVRVEVEAALRSGMPVIPVLVEGGGMPNVDQLSDSLKELVYRNGLDVGSGRDFDQHMERLIRNIEPILAQRAEAARQAEEEQRRSEAARQAEEEKRRAEAARQAEEEKRRAEAARRAEGEKRQAWPSKPPADKRPTGFSARIPFGLSVVGVLPALLMALLTLLGVVKNGNMVPWDLVFLGLGVALIASGTSFAIRSKRGWPVSILAGVNSLLATLATLGFMLSLRPPDWPIWALNFALLSLTFLAESAAAFLNVRSRRKLKPLEIGALGDRQAL